MPDNAEKIEHLYRIIENARQQDFYKRFTELYALVDWDEDETELHTEARNLCRKMGAWMDRIAAPDKGRGAGWMIEYNAEFLFAAKWSEDRGSKDGEPAPLEDRERLYMTVVSHSPNCDVEFLMSGMFFWHNPEMEQIAG